MRSIKLFAAILLGSLLLAPGGPRAAEFDQVLPRDATIGEIVEVLRARVLAGDLAANATDKQKNYAQARQLEKRLKIIAKLTEPVRPDERPEDARAALAMLDDAGLGGDALTLHEFSWMVAAIRDDQPDPNELAGAFVRLDELANDLALPRNKVAAFVALSRVELTLGRDVRMLRYAKLAVGQLAQIEDPTARGAGAQSILRLAQDAGVGRMPSTVQATLGFIPSAQARARAASDLARSQIDPADRNLDAAQMGAEVEKRLADGVPLEKVALLALAMPATGDSKARKTALGRVVQVAIERHDFERAQSTALGMNGEATQGKALLSVVEAIVAQGVPLEAIDIPALITAPREYARANMVIGRRLAELGYIKMAQRSFEMASARIKSIEDDKDRGETLAILAARWADADFRGRASAVLDTALQEGVHVAQLSKARAAIGASFARAGDEDAAKRWADGLASDEDRLALYTPLAIGALDKGKPGVAKEFSDKVGSSRASAPLNARIAIAALNAEDKDLFAGIVANMPEGGERIAAEAAQIPNGDAALPDDLLARLAALSDVDRLRGIPAVAAGLAKSGQRERALGLASTGDTHLKDAVLKAVAEVDRSKGALDDALALFAQLADRTEAESLVADLSIRQARDGDLQPAAERIRGLTDFRQRVHAFRTMARDASAGQDVYNLLTKGSVPAETESTQTSATRNPVEVDRTDDLQVVRLDGKPVKDRPPVLPDLDIHEANVLAAIPPLEAGVTDTSLARLNRYNAKFFEEIVGTSARDFLFNAQKSINPTYIFLSRGVFTLGQVRAQLGDNVREEIERDGNIITLRVPIVVGPFATLILSGAEAQEYRLSATTGAFIVNAGRLYVADTRLIAFNEETQSPAVQHYENKTRFRPFITAWSDSETNIAGSHLVGFGYSAGKTYGLSFTTGPKDIVRVRDDAAPPKGILVDNSFDQFLYGYYSYEAKSMSIIGNEYRDNIVYGIDPHDRSHDLRIAYNTAYGSEKKHGIIVSREVDDSFIVGNLSFENRGSGIMLDRDSIGNVVYANTTFANDQDGITLFESACNTILSNHVVKNRRGGIKIRNSWDIALLHNRIDDNHGAGIEAYIADLTTLKGNELRDFKLDPFHPVTTFSAGWNTIERNATGINLRGATGASFIDNTFRRQTPKLYAGDAQSLRVRMLGYAGTNTPVLIASQCLPKPPTAKNCKLRRSGVLPEDGQTLLFQANGDADLCIKRKNSVQADALSAAGGLN
ncbi:MAG TPA: NosD domain-containing protein [Ancylobacter sp.]